VMGGIIARSGTFQRRDCGGEDWLRVTVWGIIVRFVRRSANRAQHFERASVSEEKNMKRSCGRFGALVIGLITLMLPLGCTNWNVSSGSSSTTRPTVVGTFDAPDLAALPPGKFANDI